jgi:hypothetical protein
MTANAGSSDDHAADGPISLLAAQAGAVPEAPSGPGSRAAALIAGLLAMPGPTMAMQPGAPAIGRHGC